MNSVLLSTEIVRDPEQLKAHLRSERASSGAEELEASLFGSVLEKMQKSLSIEDENNNDAGRDTWSAIGVHAIAQCLAHKHVLGIAQMVEHALCLDSGSSSPGMKAAPAPAQQMK